MRKNWLIWASGLAVFLMMFLFYTEAHPIVMYDADDWKGMATQRVVAFPKWGDHNPIKVLPETVMPLVGMVAGYVVTPFIGDYVTAVTVTAALVLSLVIAVYIALFIAVCRKCFNLPDWAAACLGMIFLAFHFLALRHATAYNMYLLFSVNLTCYFNYTIPLLWTGSLIFYFLLKPISGNYSPKGDSGHDVCLVFLIYLAIFSNILHSIILIAFVMSDLALNLRRFLKERGSLKLWKEFCSGQKFWLGMIVLWLVSLLFESTGGRANQMAADSIALVIGNLAGIILQPNKGIYILVSCGILFGAGAIYTYVRRRKANALGETDRFFCDGCSRFGLSALIWIFFVTPVCSVAGAHYMSRIDVVCGLFFYILLLILWPLAYLLAEKTNFRFVLPVLLLVIACRTINTEQPMRDSTIFGIPPQNCAAVTRDIIGAIKAADAAGADSVNLHVPKGFMSMDNNWPISVTAGEDMSCLLYGYGQISRPINVIIVPDESLNLRYHIPR